MSCLYFSNNLCWYRCPALISPTIFVGSSEAAGIYQQLLLESYQLQAYTNNYCWKVIGCRRIPTIPAGKLSIAAIMSVQWLKIREAQSERACLSGPRRQGILLSAPCRAQMRSRLCSLRSAHRRRCRTQARFSALPGLYPRSSLRPV